MYYVNKFGTRIETIIGAQIWYCSRLCIGILLSYSVLFFFRKIIGATVKVQYPGIDNETSLSLQVDESLLAQLNSGQNINLIINRYKIHYYNNSVNILSTFIVKSANFH